ncbi:MGMT family protein [Kangiella sp. TOML190]|uniref:MGMT family protein n=1 Tax=Kangiella sp. TOML190 TaxID=2931351 RepID=UPI00204124F3|nr:MGMT family protein [Kangiella sp. TOML190]
MTSHMEYFRQQVYLCVAQIPAGKVASYGQIARLAGFPRHARHVSKALGAADKSLQLPWQRVIGANGRIAFKADSDHYARQAALLKKEGVKIINGKINMQQFAWQYVKDKQSDFRPEEFFK